MRKKIISLLGACGMLAMTTACTPDVAEIQRITQQICGFVPTAVVIAGIFPNPFTVPASAVAQAICAAVANQVPPMTRRQMARRGRAAATSLTVTVQGQTVQVSGYFTR